MGNRVVLGPLGVGYKGDKGDKGDTGAPGTQGPPGFGNWRGSYNGATTYAFQDTVLGSDGVYYFATGSTIGHDPVADTTHTYWQPTLPGAAARTGADNTIGDANGVGALPVANVTHPKWGAKADAILLTDAAMTSGSNVLSSPSYTFTSADVGKAVAVQGTSTTHSSLQGNIPGPIAGYIGSVSGGNANLVTTSGGSTALNAGTTQSGVQAVFGTDLGIAINNAYAAGAYRIYVPYAGAGTAYFWHKVFGPTSSVFLDFDHRVTLYHSNASGTIFNVQGSGLDTSAGKTALLTTDAYAGDPTLTVAAGASFVKGEVLFLSSTDVWDTTEPNTTCGEFVKVQGVSGAQVALYSPVDGPNTYFVASGAKVQKMNFLDGIKWNSPRWVCATPEVISEGFATPAPMTIAAGGATPVRFSACRGYHVAGLRASGWGGTFFLDGPGNLDGVIDHPIFRDGAKNPASVSSIGSYGYGITHYGSQNCIDRNTVLDNMHGGVNMGGSGGAPGSPPINMPSHQCHSIDPKCYGCQDTPLVAHQEAANCSFDRPKIFGGPKYQNEDTHAAMIVLGGHGTKAFDPYFENVPGLHISLGGDSEAFNVRIRRARGRAIAVGSIGVVKVDASGNAVAGRDVGTLTAGCSAGATSISVLKRDKINPGDMLTIEASGALQESVWVSPSYVRATGAGTVTLQVGTVNAHSSGVSVGRLVPPKIEGLDIDGTALNADGSGGCGVVTGATCPNYELLRVRLRNIAGDGILESNSGTPDSGIIDDLYYENVAGYVIHNNVAAVTSPSQRWRNVRGTYPGLGVANKPSGLVPVAVQLPIPQAYIFTASNSSWSIPTLADGSMPTKLKITVIGAGGGGGGGGASSAISNQVGGGGGCAALATERLDPIGTDTSLNITVGGGGAGGAAGTAGGGAGGSGSRGGTSSVVGNNGNISATSRGGAGGVGGGNNSSTTVNGGGPGPSGASTLGALILGGGSATATQGTGAGDAVGMSGAGGGGGCPTSATLGGLGGAGGSRSTLPANQVSAGGNGTTAGAAGGNGVHSGCGGGGGGGGAWNGGTGPGAGGVGGAGAGGKVIVELWP